MVKKYFNWKTFLVVVAAIIAVTSLYYANHLTKKLAIEERKKVNLIGLALESIVLSNGDVVNTVAATVISGNTTIPLLISDKNGKIEEYINVDTTLSKEEFADEIESIKNIHTPIQYSIGSNQIKYIYFGESDLLRQLRYFPYVLLFILLLFVVIVISYISSTGRYVQDRVWVGMSKETAHQLGTPLTSLVAWIEYLKGTEIEKKSLEEMEKDVNRLQLIADRFSKIGSVPKLEEEDLLLRLQNNMNYMQKRASKHVQFELKSNKQDIIAVISGPLFDWVIENLIRNALDAMDGKGKIMICVEDQITQTIIDVTDTGKGIAQKNIAKVFKPGFSTKKRGWGLGLSLAKRIVSEYHYGDIFVKKSELGKGTTFRIILKR